MFFVKGPGAQKRHFQPKGTMLWTLSCEIPKR